MLECKLSQTHQFFPIQGRITPDVLVRPRIGVIQDLAVIYIGIKFGTDWFIFADARVYTNANTAIFLIQGQITRTVLF